MKEKIRKGLFLLMLAVFVVSTVILLRQMLDKRLSGESYNIALEIAMENSSATAQAPVTEPQTEPSVPETVWVPERVEEDPVAEEMAQINLAALREVNPDVIGWIRIPETKIDYPILQGQDNDFYLKHSWDKKENYVGSVFLEHRNSPDLMDFNTIIYAHNMNDDSMFGSLSGFTDRYYWEKRPYVYIATGEGVMRYEIFASYKADLDSPTYGLSFNQAQTKVDFILHALEQSRYETGIVPRDNDRVLTLSTCTSEGVNYRWVVQARLKMVPVQS